MFAFQSNQSSYKETTPLTFSQVKHLCSTYHSSITLSAFYIVSSLEFRKATTLLLCWGPLEVWFGDMIVILTRNSNFEAATSTPNFGNLNN